MLYRLMYCSTAVEGITPADLSAIRETAEHNNRRLGITGILAYANGYFLQTIEGGARAVNKVFSDILKNSLHHNVFILSYSPIVTRLFIEFEMDLINEDETNRKIFFKYSTGAAFNPYEFDPQAAELLLTELKLWAKNGHL